MTNIKLKEKFNPNKTTTVSNVFTFFAWSVAVGDTYSERYLNYGY